MQNEDVFVVNYYESSGKYIQGKIHLMDVDPSMWRGLVPFSLTNMGCCGLKEVTSNAHTIHWSKTSFEAWLAQAFRYQGVGKTLGGVLIATATSGQEAYKKWLVKVGFISKEIFHNFNSGNKVELFHYYLPKDLSKFAWKRRKSVEEKVVEVPGIAPMVEASL